MMKKFLVLLLVLFVLFSFAACNSSENYMMTGKQIYDAFYDNGLQFFVGVGEPDDPSSMLNYAYYSLVEYWGKEVPSATIFNALSQRFDISEEFKQDMLFMARGMAPFGGWGYNSENDTFRFIGGPIADELELLGYVHNTGNQYTVYYFYSSDTPPTEVLFKVEIEYNRANGKPNKYLLIEEVSTTPDNMIEY